MINSLGIIMGAIASHILVLGVNVSNDGGGLFTLAIIVLIASSVYLIIYKNEILSFINNFKK